MKDYKEFNQQEFNRWIASKGGATLRVNYPLDENSVVFDAGGFKGKWAEKIYNKYQSNIYVFEPIKSHINIINQKFSANDKVKVYEFGLSNKDQEMEIFHSGDASSIFGGGKTSENIQLKSMIDFMKNNKIENIDLIKINIEGGEYDLLEDMIDKNVQSSFGNIQIQFHRFVPDCVERRNKIREELKKTHELTYDYEFIWENWKMK